MFLGLTHDSLFLACAIFLLAVAEARPNKMIGVLAAALGLVFLLPVVGYDIGKDRALHENRQSSVVCPGRAAA